MSAPAYRVWLGRRQPGDWTRFVDSLRQIFVPATWQTMRQFGLLAYLPSVLAEAQMSDLPDETALLVYTDSSSYEAAKKTVAGRAYNLLHSAVFSFAEPRRSLSDWASTYPDPPAPNLSSWVWPASQGPRLTDANAAVVYLVLRHGAEAQALDVRSALGAVEGELVVCRAKALSFVWLATQGARASDVASHVRQSQPTWKVEAAHDAIRTTCDQDPFAKDAKEIELRSNQTLQFTR